MTTLGMLAPEIFGSRGVAGQIYGREAELVLRGLVRDGRFGTAVQFVEGRLWVFRRLYAPLALESLLKRLKMSAKAALQERSEISQYEIDKILARENAREDKIRNVLKRGR